jgi:hypothetical protein
MKRARISRTCCVVTLLIAMLAAWSVRGDGGVVLLRESQDPFSVTVFATQETDQDGLTDVSVLIQGRKSGEVLLDADVNLAIYTTNYTTNRLAIDRGEPLCGLLPSAASIQSPDTRDHQSSVLATHKHASNKLLYAAALNLNATEGSRLRVNISRGSESARFECPLLFSQASRRSTVLWPYLAFPPIAIIAFALNQWLRRGSLEKGFDYQSQPPAVRAKRPALIERTSRFCFAKL